MAAVHEDLASRRSGDDERLLLVRIEPWATGVMGLVAGKLAEEYGRPVVVTHEHAGEVRGSARGTATFDVLEAFRANADLLHRFGGHRLAAGFTTPVECMEALADRLRARAWELLADADVLPTMEIDAEVTLAQLTWQLFDQLLALEPCGVGNRLPSFLCRRLKVIEFRCFGNNHLRLIVGRGPQQITAVVFKRGDLHDFSGAACRSIWCFSWRRTNGTATGRCSFASAICPSNQPTRLTRTSTRCRGRARGAGLSRQTRRGPRNLFREYCTRCCVNPTGICIGVRRPDWRGERGVTGPRRKEEKRSCILRYSGVHPPEGDDVVASCPCLRQLLLDASGARGPDKSGEKLPAAEQRLSRSNGPMRSADRAHAGMVRRSGEPYVLHPLAAALIVAGMRLDATTIMAALLHDVVEDTNVGLPEMREQFGPAVAHIVDGVTKFEEIGRRQRNWADQQALTLRTSASRANAQSSSRRKTSRRCSWPWQRTHAW